MQDLYTSLAILSLVSFLLILFAGASDKFVVYFDFKDLLLTISPWAIAILTYILLHVYQHVGKLDLDNLSQIQQAIYKSGFVITIAISFYSIRKAQIHNKNFFIGFVIGIFRLISSLIAFVVLFEQIYKLFHGRTTYREAAVATMIIGVFVWLGEKLINGERVYIKNGWDG